MKFKKLVKQELKEIKSIKNDIMALYSLDEFMGIMRDQYKTKGLCTEFDNAMKDNDIFEHKYYFYYYDNLDKIIEIDNYIFSDFIDSLESELLDLKAELKGVH